MKKILPAIFFLFNVQLALCQSYTIPEPGLVQGCLYSRDYTSPGYNNSSFKYVDDTTMCGYTYGRVCDINVPGGSYTCGTGIYYKHLRQENGKVYLREGTDCQYAEILLYDFNMVVNDTINLTYSVNVTGKYVADTVKYVTMLDNSSRKYIHLHSLTSYGYTSLQWIEGIGDINLGLFYDSDFEGGYNILICHKENNVIVYKNPGYIVDCDSLTLGATTGMVTIKKNTIDYAYNNTTRQLQITQPGNEDETVSIYNMLGQIIMASGFSSNTYTISLGDIAEGVYIIRLGDEKSAAKSFRLCKF